jgi:hypothetical protein
MPGLPPEAVRDEVLGKFASMVRGWTILHLKCRKSGEGARGWG